MSLLDARRACTDFGTCPSFGSVTRKELNATATLATPTDALDRAVIALNRYRAAPAAPIVTVIPISAIPV